MRSQAQLIRRSRSILKASAAASSAPRSSARPGRLSKRGDQASPRATSRVFRRLSSAAPPSAPENDGTTPVEPEAPEQLEDTPPEEPEKPKRRTRASKPDPAPPSTPPLPDGIDILWSPQGSTANEESQTRVRDLPYPEILEEAQHNLHITLHPQTQHRATYPSSTGPPVEPTLGLYCPIEGGEYVIDETVRELALRTGSDVVVVDCVQLAAGEWGHFGQAASALQLPKNPLHVSPSPPPPSKSSHTQMMTEDMDDERGYFDVSPVPQMTLHLMAPPSLRSRAMMASSRANSAPSKVKAFFDDLVNIPSAPLDPSIDSPFIPSDHRPRIIYVRDFATLAPTSSSWYPPLLSAVRQRRQGPISRPTSPVDNPTTIIFGMTPPLTPPQAFSSSSSGGQLGMMNFLMSRNRPPAEGVSNHKPTKSDWAEGRNADKAREKRLRDRLKKWEQGDVALQDELPTLSVNGDDGTTGGGQRPDVVVIGSPSGMPGLPSQLQSALSGPDRGSPHSESEANQRFFRTSVLVPAVRSLEKEKASRVSRRREINELTMRMAVGAIGGRLESREVDEVPAPVTESSEASADPPIEGALGKTKMWENWGQRIEFWSTVRQIADRAVGSIVASDNPPLSLEHTPVPWDAVHRAWLAQKSLRDIRKDWITKPSTKSIGEDAAEDEGAHATAEGSSQVDEVVERIKQDPDIQPHESRLLSCIVDSAAMPTSFSQVHLPPHTIDSVRTIVSLPLLHPTAFQQGILKEHGMTGCLLFGPPGTGKTLVVRALAKEAGCRMLAISPSDVMDMYVGEAEKLVKAVFTLARRLSPCVVFLDEIDALFGARMSSRESGGAHAHRGVITEFMQEMDGLKSSPDDRVIVIGATNRPFDLDDAVLRRLPRRLLVDLPGEKEREEILKILLRDETLSPDLNLQELAKKTETFSGSDLKHLCVSAALDAVKERVELPWSTSSSVAKIDVASEPAQPSLTATVDSSDPDPATKASPRPESASGAAPPQSSVEPPPILDISPTVAEDALPSDAASDMASPPPPVHSRVLALHNFTKALKEITPSSSESLGTLSELRKWNEEFGEGRKDKRKKQVWGKGRFGFIDKGQGDQLGGEGRVALPSSSTSRTTGEER